MAKRMALYAISSSASRYKKAIIPLISFNAEFYIRIIFMVKESPELCMENISNHGHILQCRSCQYRKLVNYGAFDTKGDKKAKFRLSSYESLPEKCPVCEGPTILVGPFWIGGLHNEEFLVNLGENLKKDEYQYLKYNKRIVSIINRMTDEMELEKEPFTYSYSQLCSDVNISAPKLGILK